jgi:hypothetical protein
MRPGVFAAALEALADSRNEEGLRELRACFLEGSFAPARRGGARVGQTKKGPGRKILALVAADGWPVAITSDSAHPHELKWVEQTRAARLVDALPERRMGDKA